MPPGDTNLAAVAAIVVTYRRPRLATQVVRGLVEQEGFAPDRVLLVVNGEGGLEDESLERAIKTLRLPTNLGPAGGFRRGMQEVFASAGTSWAYLCEDDVGLFDLPTPRVARTLGEVTAREARREGGTVGAVVAYGRREGRRAGSTEVFVPAPGSPALAPVDAAAWGATLVSRRVFEAGVLPDEQLFFGYEDFDFFYSMRRAGFELLVDVESARDTARHMSLHGRDRAIGAVRPTDAEEAWRAYYVARNFFVLARRHGDARWLAWHLAHSVRRMQLAATRGERLATLAGLRDGARGRSGFNPRYARRVGERRQDA